MKYGLLTQEDNFMNLAPESITMRSGISRIMLSMENALEWLKIDSTNQLIITMPIQEDQRMEIKNTLRDFDERCIALDPEMLYSGSSPQFSNTQKVQIGISGQIKGIIEANTTIPA